ncbi:radial spoke head 10 homolog B [Pseudoliparis swirei]|uniref:radial spoke head 10 homolog B n=1 Tax=Pseudoliparis swirei TaxID=2059687 RepID=UPI0024BEA56D|nr:radial spoke head 10 homolog B [Pseudoliparis swirei]
MTTSMSPRRLGLTLKSYEGETCDGQFHGEGVACFEERHIYKGRFSKGLMDGPGVLTTADGFKYEGEFVCNLPMGKGTCTWPDGSSYKGEMDNGIRHGTGTYTCASRGVSYTGQWDRGKRHGKGTVYFNQDKTSWYKGDWVKNDIEGWGVRRYPSGNIYSGEWKNSRRHGEGTMTWLNLGQQYAGMWQNEVQHGRGTHVWVTWRADGSQYSQSNYYTGDFTQGQMHGQGTFHYANGAIYKQEWRGNNKHGKAKFTFEDGYVVEGEFVDDQMMTTPDLKDHNAPPALPDMVLNIECLLEKIPERERATELEQVEFVVLSGATELRSVYRFYSRLGHTHSPDNTFRMSRLQFWRLLKDCNVHHHGVTVTQVERLLREDAPPAEIHSPFISMLQHRVVSCLVMVAYHIYHKDMTSQNNLLAACFSQLMTSNIRPGAKNVKGFLFRRPGRAVAAESYLEKCWEVYQDYCKVHVTPDQSMSGRHLLWMFKDLRLLDTNLTTARLLRVITAESRDPSNPSACLDLEVTFLEFFEVLLGSAEVKCQLVPEGPVGGGSPSSPDGEAGREAPEVAAPVNSPIAPETSSSKSAKLSDTAESSTAEDGRSQVIETEVAEKPNSAEQSEGNEALTRGTEAEDGDVDLWSQTIHLFFNQFFFPAFQHNQLLSRKMEEKLRREAQRRRAWKRSKRDT